LSDRLSSAPRSLIGRVAVILSTFVSGSSHSITEIARLTGLPVSTTHRLTAELSSWQMLNRTEDGRYEVGLALQRLRGDVSLPADLHERAPHVITDLCEVTHRRARLGVLRDGRVAYIEKQVGSRPASCFSVHALLPAHATALGKVLLAFSPREAVAPVEQSLTAFTPHTLTSPDQLRRALHAVRLTHRAVSRGELFSADTAVAVPVFGNGNIVAALELEVVDPRVDGATCTAALEVAARGMSRELALDARAGRPHLRLLPGEGGARSIPVDGTSAAPRGGDLAATPGPSVRRGSDGACPRLNGGSRVPQEA
jgi:IclR family acetate operon transcriptional repressor